MEPDVSLPYAQKPFFHILSHVNPAHIIPSYFFKIPIILSSFLILGLPDGRFPSDFPTKTLYVFIFSLKRATCPANLILLAMYIVRGYINLKTDYSSASSAEDKNAWSYTFTSL